MFFIINKKKQFKFRTTCVTELHYNSLHLTFLLNAPLTFCTSFLSQRPLSRVFIVATTFRANGRVSGSKYIFEKVGVESKESCVNRKITKLQCIAGAVLVCVSIFLYELRKGKESESE